MKLEIYMERMNIIFEANDITTETKKREVFLTSMGEKPTLR